MTAFWKAGCGESWFRGDIIVGIRAGREPLQRLLQSIISSRAQNLIFSEVHYHAICAWLKAAHVAKRSRIPGVTAWSEVPLGHKNWWCQHAGLFPDIGAGPELRAASLGAGFLPYFAKKKPKLLCNRATATWDRPANNKSLAWPSPRGLPKIWSFETQSCAWYLKIWT